MRAALLLVALSLVLACGSSETTAPGPTDSAINPDGTTDGTVSDGPAPGAGCAKAGGMCGCAGSCNPGYHPATGALLFDCPQPCPGCGGCGQQCCLKDDDAGADASDAAEAG